MARRRGKLDQKNESQEVVNRYRNEKVAWKKERLLAIKLLLETERTYQEVADIVGRARSIVQVWAKTFQDGGIESLLTRGMSRSGRKSRLSEHVKEQMVEKLSQGSFRTAKQFQGWLREEHQIELSEKGIYYHLGKLGGRLKVPRPSHLKKDESKEKEFRNTLAEKLIELDLPKDRELSLWVYDEMRYGLHPLLRKMWSLIGTRVVAPVRRRFQWGYLFGAIEVSEEQAGSEFLFTDGVAKDFDRAFLEQISKSDPNKIHVVIGDGAGFHHKEGQQEEIPLPENVRIITLPAYSPELNPMEKYWDVIKDAICTRCWESMEELENKIMDILKEWWRKPHGFSSLFTHSYLRTELNAIYPKFKP